MLRLAFCVNQLAADDQLLPSTIMDVSMSTERMALTAAWAAACHVPEVGRLCGSFIIS